MKASEFEESFQISNSTARGHHAMVGQFEDRVVQFENWAVQYCTVPEDLSLKALNEYVKWKWSSGHGHLLVP